MKKLAFAALAAATFSAGAFAQGYVGGAVGRADHHQNRSDWTRAGVTTTYDDSDNAFKVFGGYRFNPNFSIEGGFMNLRYYTARLSGGGDNGTARIKTNGLNVFGVGTLPVSESFSVFAKAGISRNRSDMTFTSGGIAFNASDNAFHSGADLAWGVGASYALSRQFAMRLEFEDFGKAGETNNGFTQAGRTSNSKPRLWSIGLQYGF